MNKLIELGVGGYQSDGFTRVTRPNFCNGLQRQAVTRVLNVWCSRIPVIPPRAV